MKNSRYVRIYASAQKGFTLIELMIVGIIISILISILASQFLGSSDAAKASAMVKVADGSFRQLQALNVTCGTPTTIAGNPLPAAGYQLSDVFFMGLPAVAAPYSTNSNCYAKASIKPLIDLGQATSTASSYTVQGFPVSYTDVNARVIKVSFANVPDSVVLELASRYNSTITALAASDTTSNVIQYTASSGGLRTLSILRQ